MTDQPTIDPSNTQTSPTGEAGELARANLEVQEQYKEIKRPEELERKDEFLAMLAHELRNPLAPIQNAVQVLRQISGGGPEIRRQQDIIQRQVEHMSHLLNDLLDVSRTTRGAITLDWRRMDLRDLIFQCVQTYDDIFRHHGIKLACVMPERHVYVDVDFTRMSQVLMNLFNNCVKFSKQGGYILIRCELLAARTAEANRVRISVKDNGIGIEPEVLPHVFDLFSQAQQSLDRSKGGLGIGLTLVKRLVELHGGSVWVSSGGLGMGCEFMIDLPVTEPPAQTGEDLEEPQNIQETMTESSPIKILIVDDNADAADSLGELIELMGHQICVAYEGTRALEVAREFMPEIVLLDIGLPGMNGYEVAKEMRKIHGFDRTMLVALTGYGRAEDRQQAREHGFDQHYTKPISLEGLEKLLHTLR